MCALLLLHGAAVWLLKHIMLLKSGPAVAASVRA